MVLEIYAFKVINIILILFLNVNSFNNIFISIFSVRLQQHQRVCVCVMVRDDNNNNNVS